MSFFAQPPAPERPRLSVLISGAGSNLQALLDAIQAGRLEAEIVRVISNRRQAHGLLRAAMAGVKTAYFPLKPYRDAGRVRSEYDADLAQLVLNDAPDLVICAGWMHIDSGPLVRAFRGRIINLHPALPGEFPGAHGIAEAFAAWQRGEIERSGCMVHHVIEALDAGPVIGVREVAFVLGDTLESFAERLHAAEHELIVESTREALRRIRVPSGQAIKRNL